MGRWHQICSDLELGIWTRQRALSRCVELQRQSGCAANGWRFDQPFNVQFQSHGRGALQTGLQAVLALGQGQRGDFQGVVAAVIGVVRLHTRQRHRGGALPLKVIYFQGHLDRQWPVQIQPRGQGLGWPLVMNVQRLEVKTFYRPRLLPQQ